MSKIFGVSDKWLRPEVAGRLGCKPDPVLAIDALKLDMQSIQESIPGKFSDYEGMDNSLCDDLGLRRASAGRLEHYTSHVLSGVITATLIAPQRKFSASRCSNHDPTVRGIKSLTRNCSTILVTRHHPQCLIPSLIYLHSQ